MKKKVLLIISPFIALIMVGAIAACNSTDAAAQQMGVTYAVTVYNTTHGQVITPPIVIAHNSGFRLFTPGDTASDELATMAEEGDPSSLAANVETDSSVMAVATGDGVIPPGNSATIMITAPVSAQITVAGMLAITNDAFFAVRGVAAPASGTTTVNAEAYDAGSEANNESCDFVPGPPCGSGGARAMDGEGFIHVHPGIHGIADLDASVLDWRGHVAEVSIETMN